MIDVSKKMIEPTKSQRSNSMSKKKKQKRQTVRKPKPDKPAAEGSET
jgi:hypothetical protein